MSLRKRRWGPIGHASLQEYMQGFQSKTLDKLRHSPKLSDMSAYILAVAYLARPLRRGNSCM